MTVEVRVEGVTKRFGRVVALDNVTLTMPRGRFTVLLGPSGSGKTTLLYTIAGIYKPTSGRILFDGRDVTKLPPNKRNVGLVFQNYALYPHMRVYDNIAFPLKLRKLPRRVIDEKVHWVAKLLRIEELLDRYPHQLSGGQQQRVALARALVKEPDVLLLDEPLSNLDALLRLHIRSELKRLQRKLGITAIYVTHDQQEAMALADVIVVMSTGKVQQVGTPEEVYAKPRNIFVAQFIGTPPANILRGRLGVGRVEVPGGWLPAPPELLEKARRLNLEEVIVGFRPEHARLAGEPPGVEAELLVVEKLGREVVAILDARGVEVKVLLEPSEAAHLEVGSKYYIRVEPAKLLLFDPSSEVNLEYIEA